MTECSAQVSEGISLGTPGGDRMSYDLSAILGEISN